MDLGAQDFEVGRGKPGDILRNLLLEVSEDSEAIQMFRVLLTEHQQLCATRAAIEQQAD